MNENRRRKTRKKRRLSQVQRKRAIKQYVMIALIMGTVGFCVMLIEEVLDSPKDKAASQSPFADDPTPPSIFSPEPGGTGGGGQKPAMSAEQLKQMKKAAEMLGIVK